MALASSSGVPLRRIGTVAISASLPSSVPVKRSSMTVSVGPGPTAFTRIPEFPCSSATVLVRPSTANLLLTYAQDGLGMDGSEVFDGGVLDNAELPFEAGIVHGNVETVESRDRFIDE